MKGALDTALTYLSRRILSRYELVQRLTKKGFSEQEINSALERLLEWGYINDQEYARAYCLSKQANHSKKRISYDLKGRGIQEHIVEHVFEENYQPEQEIELCFKHAQKIWTEESRRWESSYQHKKSYEKIPREVFLKLKVGQKLMQKGYPQDMVQLIIERVLKM
ncbi:regulatory protein RecX [Desulfitobacterium dichloroeliminans]|nr:RecX family transcriptional regulator [Desulfitobacterium dichloroeliminans]